MDRGEYCIELAHLFSAWNENFEKGRRIEGALRNFLLQKSDRMRFTRFTWWEGIFPPRKRGGDDDPKFIENCRILQPDFIETESSSKRYNDISQGRGRTFQHYFYRLSEQMKERISKETLPLFITEPTVFYGFEDPTFYKGEEMLGCYISHESMIILYLTSNEKAALEKDDLIKVLGLNSETFGSSP